MLCGNFATCATAVLRSLRKGKNRIFLLFKSNLPRSSRSQISAIEEIL